MFKESGDDVSMTRSGCKTQTVAKLGRSTVFFSLKHELTLQIAMRYLQEGLDEFKVALGRGGGDGGRLLVNDGLCGLCRGEKG